MPRLQDTAYPRLKSVLTARDLATAFTPTADELVLARRAANGPAAQLGFLVLLKLFQRLGRPVLMADATQPVVEHIARAAGIVAGSLRLEGYEADAANPTLSHLRDLVTRHRWLATQAIGSAALADIPAVRLRHFAEEAKTLDAARMQALEPRKRATLTVALLTVQAARALDFCYGSNMGPSQAARSLIGLDRRQIEWINQRHVIEDGQDEAGMIVVNGYHRFLLTRAWGSGKHVSADGTQWDTYKRNLLTERHIRYGGFGGIAYYHSPTCTLPSSATSSRAAPTRARTSWTRSTRTRATSSPTRCTPIPVARAPRFSGLHTFWVSN